MQNNNIKPKMKKFRSSKVLKPIDPQSKQQSQLRAKIKNLQQQIEMLQKSNLNIFIPISEHTVQPTTDYQSIIRQLRQKIGHLQSENQTQKYTIKKQQRQKEQIKKQYQEQLSKHQQTIKQLQQINKQLEQANAELEQEIEYKKKENQKLQRDVIEKNVQLKFMAEELLEEKNRVKNYVKKIQEYNAKINGVIYGSRIHNSLSVKIICLEKKEYDELKRKISELEAELQKLRLANCREVITLGSKKNDIGEEIVRLKKNIDVQLGLQGNSKHSEEFLKVYQSTQNMITDLLNKCKT